MANFKFLWSGVLLALCLQAPYAVAQLSANQKTRLQETVKIYNQSMTLGGFINGLRPQLTDPQYRFLMGKIAGSENVRLVPLKTSGDDGFSMVADGTAVKIQYLSFADHVIRVNNKSIDLGAASDMDSQWQLIEAALPQRRTNALFNLLIPQAEAFWPIVAGIGGVVIGIYWLVEGDPCDTLTEPLVNCAAAVKNFDKLKKAHQDWPWEGTDADRLKKAKAGAKACDKTDDDCNNKKALLSSGACTPSWASEMDKSDVLAAAIANLSSRIQKFRSSRVFDNSVTQQHASFMICKDYPALQQCLTTLIHDMNGVCIQSSKLPHVNDALDKPAGEAVK